MKLILLILILQCGTVLGATPSRLSDGKVELAVAEVNGIICWTDKQRDDVIAGIMATTGTVNSTNYTPTTFDIGVATSGLKFSNYTDFKKCITEKDYLADRIDDLSVSESKRNKSSLDYLKSENSKR